MLDFTLGGRLRGRALALALAGAASLSLAGAATAGAAVTLSTTNGRPTQIAGGGAATPYSTAESIWLRCPGSGTPLMLGWSGVAAPIGIVYSNDLQSARTLGLAVRRPLGAGGTLRTTALCASGPVGARTKESSSGTVSCSRGQVAIGVPIDGGPYWTRAVASMPVGTRGWRNTEGGYARAKAICVAGSAFRSVAVATRRASLRARREDGDRHRAVPGRHAADRLGLRGGAAGGQQVGLAGLRRRGRGAVRREREGERQGRLVADVRDARRQAGRLRRADRAWPHLRRRGRLSDDAGRVRPADRRTRGGSRGACRRPARRRATAPHPARAA